LGKLSLIHLYARQPDQQHARDATSLQRQHYAPLSCAADALALEQRRMVLINPCGTPDVACSASSVSDWLPLQGRGLGNMLCTPQGSKQKQGRDRTQTDEQRSRDVPGPPSQCRRPPSHQRCLQVHHIGHDRGPYAWSFIRGVAGGQFGINLHEFCRHMSDSMQRMLNVHVRGWQSLISSGTTQLRDANNV
jgi:hypothetical protein